MSVAIWSSVALGVALGLVNAAASYALWRLARGRKQSMFMTIIFGGMGVRMLVLLALIALVLVFAPVSRGAFVGAFFTTFAVGLIAEVIMLQRRASSPSLSTPSNG
jgi:hypothetical protein